MLQSIKIGCTFSDFLGGFIKKTFLQLLGPIILLSICFYFFPMNVNNYVNNSFDRKIIYLTILCGTLICFVPIVMFVNSIKNKMKIKSIEKENAKDLGDFEYFREIIENYSPAVLMYLYNKKYNFEDALMSTLYGLEKREVLKIKNNNILINNINVKLLANEKFFVDNIDNLFGSNALINNPDYWLTRYEWESIIKSDAETLDLIGYIDTKTKKNKTTKFVYCFLIAIFTLAVTSAEKFYQVSTFLMCLFFTIILYRSIFKLDFFESTQ